MLKNLDFDKKQIKKLNEFNQITKNYFNYYYMFDNGLLICRDHEKFKKAQKGFHFCVSTINPLCDMDDGKIFALTSDCVYKIIKDRKKDITGLALENDNILFSLTENNMFNIGKIYDYSKLPKDLMDNYNIAMKTMKQCSESERYDILHDDVTTLMTNGIINYEKKGYKLRITRELIPNLKKDSNVSIRFFDIPKDTSLFHVVITVTRDEIVSYHKYTCIKF